VPARWALVASVLLAVLAAFALWALRPSESLARDAIAHVQGEPASWSSDAHLDESAFYSEEPERTQRR
jgi:hypothetical protein